MCLATCDTSKSGKFDHPAPLDRIPPVLPDPNTGLAKWLMSALLLFAFVSKIAQSFAASRRYGTESFFERLRSLVEISDIANCNRPIVSGYPTARSEPPNRPASILAHKISAGRLRGFHRAFTGEVSGPMIKASGCSLVIVGHSKRPRHFWRNRRHRAKEISGGSECRTHPHSLHWRTLQERCGSRAGGAVQQGDRAAFR